MPVLGTHSTNSAPLGGLDSAKLLFACPDASVTRSQNVWRALLMFLGYLLLQS